MKKKMTDGSRYFRQKDIMRPLGGGMLIASILLVYFGWSWASYILACLMAPAALVMFFVGGARHISDKNMDERLADACRDYDKPITDMAGFSRTVLTQPAPVEVGAYGFGENAKYFKRAKGGTPRSDRYTKTHFFFTSENLMVIGRRVTLSEIGDNGFACADFQETFRLSEVTAALDEHATPVQMTVGGKPTTVKWCELVIADRDGGELFRVAVPNDMAVVGICDAVNRREAK